MTTATESIALRADSSDIKRGIADLRALDRQAAKTEKSAVRFGAAFGRAIAAIGVGVAFNAVIRNTIEAEQATAQLNASLQSTGRFSEATSRALRDHASALQEVTTFGDDAIVMAQAQLLTFTKLGNETFPRATEAVLDLATKMGGDLRGAVVQVGKALQDPVQGITALTRSGIQFTEAQKAQIKELVKANDLLGAQKIILGELETQFGGSAKAARDTFGGALKGLSNAFGDLLEGDTEGGGMNGATRSVNDLTDALSSPELKAGFQNLIQGTFTAVGWLARLTAAATNSAVTIGEDLAAALNGTAIDDFERRAREINALQSMVDKNREDISKGFLPQGFDAELIERTKQQILELREALSRDIVDLGQTKSPSQPGDVKISGLDTPESLDEVVVTAKKRTKELNDLIAQSARASQQASEGLADTLNTLAATMGGPPIQAAVRLSETLAMLDQYEKTLQQTNALTIDKQHQLASARALANQEYQAAIELHAEEQRLLEAQLTYAEQVIADLEFESELMGMSNQQRELAIALRYAEVDAMSAQGQEIGVLIGKIQKQREEIAGLDFVKSAGQDAFASIIDGSKSAGDAIDDFFDRLRARAAQVLAEKLFETLFGGMGQTAGGGGGWAATLGSALGSIFGGTRASGGNVMAGKVYQVGEQGPELLRMGGRQFLIPGQSGNVVPNHQITNKSSTNNTRVTVLVAPEERRKTAAQLGNATARSIARSQARNS
jgi:hypothetical protein